MNVFVPRLMCGVALCVFSVAQAHAETSFVVASAGAAKPAEAASGAAKDNTIAANKDAIVVTTTAQKRFENIQNVPLAVQVISPAELEAHGVRHFQELGKVSPSLVIRPAEQPVNGTVSLRGVGTLAFGIGVETAVAITVDGAALPFMARVYTDLPDIAQIEVLRGPQSTLYGKAASAGLVKIMTVQPTDDYHVRGTMTVTGDREYGANVSLTGPISDTLGYVFSTGYSNWDGNVRNLFNGKRTNGRETFNTRGKLRWKASPDVTFTLSGNYVDGNATIARPFVAVASNALLRGVAGQTPAVIFPGVTLDRDNQDVSNNYWSHNKFSGGGALLRSEANIGRMNVLSLTSYDRFRLDDYLDHDDSSSSAAVGSNIQVGAFKSRMFTQELRLLSPGEDAFRYALGVYYANTGFDRPFQRGPVFSLANWYATTSSRQIAGFGQIDWEFVPKLTGTVGGRIQNERVKYTFADNLARTNYAGRADDTAATYHLGLTYQATPDVMTFASYSTGYKGQTYDLTTGFNQNRAAAGPVKPERSRDRELGIRTQFFDRHLTLNATLFDTDYTNLQAQTIETLADGTSNFRLTNVGKFNTRGIEIETAARLGRDIALRGAITYLDAKYTSFPSAQCYPMQTAAQGCSGSPARRDLTGVRAPQAPVWKGNWSVDYTPPLTDTLDGFAQVAGEYQSSLYYVAADPQTFQPGFAIFDLHLGVRSHDKRWDVTAFVNNLFDQQYYASLVNTAGNFAGRMATQAVLPRDFRRYAGVRFGVNF